MAELNRIPPEDEITVEFPEFLTDEADLSGGKRLLLSPWSPLAMLGKYDDPYPFCETSLGVLAAEEPLPFPLPELPALPPAPVPDDPPVATPLMLANNDLVRDSGIVE